MGYYDITESDDRIRELVKLIQLSVTELQEAITRVRQMKDPQNIEARYIEVNRLENLANEVLEHAITDFFHAQKPIHILKFNDIYVWLEFVIDKCGEVRTSSPTLQFGVREE
jgi:uncharacterized protein Yka (UPF0111/DUF47 family)